MNIFINDVSKVIPDKTALQHALELLNIETHGAAVAVNQEIIHQGSWCDFVLSENDELVIFKLVTGG